PGGAAAGLGRAGGDGAGEEGDAGMAGPERPDGQRVRAWGGASGWVLGTKGGRGAGSAGPVARLPAVAGHGGRLPAAPPLSSQLSWARRLATGLLVGGAHVW